MSAGKVIGTMKILLLIISLVIGGTMAARLKRLVEGTPVSIEDVPYFASVKNPDGMHVCGAALISKRHVLTAAHCFPFYDESEEWTVTTGSDVRRRGGAENFIKRIDLPKKAAKTGIGSTWIHDIAVITLKEDVQLNTRQLPIKISTEVPETNSTITIAGFGCTDFVNPYLSCGLRTITTKMLKYQECRRCAVTKLREHGELLAHSVCGMTNRGPRVANGDSGGPVISDGKLVGIVSANVPDEQRYYCDIYVDVHQYLDFIRRIAG